MLEIPTPLHPHNLIPFRPQIPMPPRPYIPRPLYQPINPYQPMPPYQQTITPTRPNVLSTLKNALSAAAQRMPVLVIAADQHNVGYFAKGLGQPTPPAPSADTDFKLLSMFVSNPARTPLQIAPWRSKAQSVLLDIDDHHHSPKDIESRNINKIKNAVASLLDKNQDIVPLLFHPYTPWQFPVNSQSWQVLRNSILDDNVVNSIVTQLTHNMTNEGIDLAIKTAKKRIDHQTGVLKHWGDTKDDSDTSSDESDDEYESPEFPEKVRTAIRKIREDVMDKYEWEAQLLSNLVNPGKQTDFRLLFSSIDKSLAHIQDTWDSIALELDVKQYLLRMVSFNVEKPEAYGLLKEAQLGGALLYGPPGTGKTHLARVLAKEAKATMIQISEAEIVSKWVGETEKLIKALFNLGRMVSPCIIFMDEADALFRRRTVGDPHWVTGQINQLLSKTDGLLKDEKSRPFLILATNYPNQLDHAVLRRVPGRIYLGPPSSKLRKDLFRICLKEESIESSLPTDLARMTDNYSGSDIRTLCIHAATISQSELDSQGDAPSVGRRTITMTHFQTALKANSPTITKSAMKEIERFASQFDRQNVELIRDYLSGEAKRNIESKFNTAVRREEGGKPKSSDDQNTNISEPPVNAPTPTMTGEDNAIDIKLGPCTVRSPYQSLDQTLPQIRVLELIEAAASTNKIQGRLHTVALEPGLSFTALSYLWGDSDLNEEIILDEEPFRVTKSLADALRWVKYHWQQYFPSRKGSEFRIWADAVCINQDDNTEKSSQVSLMGDIFGMAELVISSIASGNIAISFALKTYANMWNVFTKGSTSQTVLDELANQEWMPKVAHLVQSSDHDEQSEYLEMLSKTGNCGEMPDVTASMSLGPDTTETEFIAACEKLSSNPSWIAIRELMRLPYWTRVWVMQEVVLGKKVLLICDDTSMDLQALHDATSVLKLARSASNWTFYENHRHFEPPRGWCQNCWRHAETVSGPILDFRLRLGKSRIGNADFHQTAMDTYFNKNLLRATNPRDLLYGLFGLCKLDIVVDYSKNLGRVYGDYVNYWLKSPIHVPHNTRHLTRERMKQRYHFLRLGGIDAWPDDVQMPSWIPNFQRFGTKIGSIKFPRQGFGQLSFPKEISEVIAYPDLSLAGVSIQRVERSSGVIIWDGGKRDKPYTLHRDFLSHLRDLNCRNQKYVTGITMLQAVARALVQSDDPEPTLPKDKLLLTMLTLVGTDDEIGTHRIFGPNFEEPFTNREEAVDWFIEKLDFRHEQNLLDQVKVFAFDNRPAYLKSVEQMLQTCSFFETEDGYLGIGPRSLAEGDELCLFHYCTLPVMLRRKGDHYTYVGPSWVVGLDSLDELTRLQNLGRVEERQFLMR